MENCKHCGEEYEESKITRDICFNCFQEYQYELTRVEED